VVFFIFFFHGGKAENASASKTVLEDQAKKPETAQPAKPAEPAATKLPTPSTPAASAAAQKNEPILVKPESIGVWYSTVKGDNLWNLSHSFYRNPWLYKKIAEQNGISNPNLIQQNFRLYIPDVETGRR
jgi:nucleoid-associated protein YgaU